MQILNRQRSHWCGYYVRSDRMKQTIGTLPHTPFSSQPTEESVRQSSDLKSSGYLLNIELPANDVNGRLRSEVLITQMVQPIFVNQSTTLIPTWRSTLDVVVVALLAILAMVANLGLLYLAKLTRPSVIGFNLTFPHTKISEQTSSAKLNDLKLRLRKYSCAFYEQSKRQVPYGTRASIATMEHNDDAHLRKSVSTISVSRAANGLSGTTNISTQNRPTPRTRRHRRYLRGLLGLSFSNITISLSLLSWSAVQIAQRTVAVPWLAMLCVANTAIADMAQALEVGAVLWIALERTLGIHWPREKKTSTANVENFNNQTPCMKRNLLCCLKVNSVAGKVSRCSFNHLEFHHSARYSRQHNLSKVKERYVWKPKCAKRIWASSRVFLSFLPFLLFFIASISEFVSFLRHAHSEYASSDRFPLFLWTDLSLYETNGVVNFSKIWNESVNGTRFVAVIYYTNNIVLALIVGQFLVPLAILVTTNLLIYKKVASRDKQFFSRQSSNTSKSSCVSSMSFGMSTFNKIQNRQKHCGPKLVGVIPLLRVLESSSHDVRESGTGSPTSTPAAANGCFAKEPNIPLESNVKESSKNLLSVPNFVPANGPIVRTPKDLTIENATQRRRSTSALYLDEDREFPRLKANNGDLLNCANNNTVQLRVRRKSSSDIFSALFQNRNSDAAGGAKPVEQPLLMQMLRRQHRRTLRILIIILVVFVVCRAPRAIILILGWLQTSSFCNFPQYAHYWLLYASLWTHTSAIFDTIVYGFWGNRTYRMHLGRWYAKNRFCCQ
ncbi:unnamed protein product [Dicrocoelium dendriticum]|nr:unnamed protein product [Dicrocoelium dendriticum]